MHVRRIAGLVASAAVLGLLAGCAAPGDASTAQKQHVTVWLYPVIPDEAAHRAYWDETITAFEKTNPDITVDYEIFPWANRDEAIQTAVASNTAPDLIYLIPDQLAAYQDAIEPMDAYLSDNQKSQLLDNVKTSVTLDGQLMGAPILTSALALVCNAKVFAAAGVSDYPSTWDDFLADAKKFADADLYALHYPASPENSLNNTFYPLLWQAGGEVFDDAGGIAIDSEAAQSSLAFLTSLMELDAIDPEPITTNPAIEQTALAQNKTACTWSNAVNELEPFWGEENVKVLAPLTGKQSITYGTVGSLTMFKNSKNKEAAGKFAEYATSADVVVPYLKQAGFFSALNSTPELYADQPLLSAVEKIVPKTTVGQINPKSREVMGVISPEIQAALLGQKSPSDALAAAAAAAKPLLGQ